jgi:hypothetical protein
LTEYESLQKQIKAIKQELNAIGDMRPGDLNQQFRKPKEKSGEYFQLNYTFSGRTRTEYVRKENVPPVVSAELEEYQRAKDLFANWIELSIQASKMRLKK